MRKQLLTLVLTWVAFSISAQEVPNLQRPLFTKITATWCPNCGTWGWSYMKDVIAQNGDDMLVVGAHYSGELENDAGDFFQSVFRSSGQPRFIFGNQDQGVRSSNLVDKLNETDAAVKDLMAQQPEMGVGMNVTVSNQSLDVHTKTKFFAAVDGTYYLSLYLIENDVIEEQAAVGPNAMHPMVVRSAFTDGGEGIEIVNGSIALDTEIEHDFSLTRQPEWNLENSYVYAIIWKKEGEQFIYENGHRVEIMNTVISTHDELILSDLKVFPTVSEGIFHIEIPSDVLRTLSLSVLDPEGKRLDQIPFQPQSGQRVIDLGHLPAGNYLLNARIGDTQRSIPIIKVD